MKKQNYDPIYVETLDDHEYFNWILEESPLLLTNDEINALFHAWTWLKATEKGFNIPFNQWSTNLLESFG